MTDVEYLIAVDMFVTVEFNVPNSSCIYGVHLESKMRGSLERDQINISKKTVEILA